MELLTAYQGMIKVHGWIGTAATLGMSRSALEARVYEVKGSGMRTTTALLIQAHAGSTLFAEAVCHASGGTFLPFPTDVDADGERVMEKFNELYIELGTFSKHFADATKDDVIDESERKQLEADSAKLHRVIAGLQRLAFSVYCAPRSEA